MKRFLFWFALTLIGIIWLLRVGHHRAPHPDRVMVHESVDPAGHTRKVYLDQHGRVVQLVSDAVADEDAADTDRGPGVRREPAEGLPVPVVPGTRTTEARAEPPAPAHRTAPRWRRAERNGPPRTVSTTPLPSSTPGTRAVTGRLSATEERARNDARERFVAVLAGELAPEIPRDWKLPPALVEGMIRDVKVTPRERDYGTVYEATIVYTLPPQTRAEIVAVYHREQVVKRLVTLGAVLAFVLACLAAVSGYIKADEATKGYYTSRLRLAAVAAVAVAGVVVARLLRVSV